MAAADNRAFKVVPTCVGVNRMMIISMSSASRGPHVCGGEP